MIHYYHYYYLLFCYIYYMDHELHEKKKGKDRTRMSLSPAVYFCTWESGAVIILRCFFVLHTYIHKLR